MLKRYRKQASPIDENLCPQCGRPMVLRIATYGDNQGNQFLGCSGYPRCRMTKQII
ncbi:topoisomerase DNA-binding C4 zinc finger domain-containing protein [Methylobacter sp.]|uniref:topoisomerase DNA-binding C4 zinc finger domain-containing protein n=1 Tax=Methylobacter sp. TaxID=2051955 RepID=UPI00338D9948